VEAFFEEMALIDYFCHIRKEFKITKPSLKAQKTVQNTFVQKSRSQNVGEIDTFVI